MKMGLFTTLASVLIRPWARQSPTAACMLCRPMRCRRLIASMGSLNCRNAICLLPPWAMLCRQPMRAWRCKMWRCCYSKTKTILTKHNNISTFHWKMPTWWITAYDALICLITLTLYCLPTQINLNCKPFGINRRWLVSLCCWAWLSSLWFMLGGKTDCWNKMSRNWKHWLNSYTILIVNRQRIIRLLQTRIPNLQTRTPN